MKSLTVALALCAGASAVSLAQDVSRTAAGDDRQTLEIQRQGSQPPQRGSADYFIGTVQVESRFQRSDPARVSGATVIFEPGARTAWHTHPLGQTLIVTAGAGWVQREGGAKQEIHPGDVVWIPPNVKHWHGAQTKSSMAHVAIAESLNGSVVQWMEQVSEAQYRAEASKP